MCARWKSNVGLVAFRRDTIEIFRNCRVSGSERLKNAHEHHNRGLGVTKAQYIQATMDYMENAGNPVLCDVMWWVVSDMVAYST